MFSWPPAPPPVVFRVILPWGVFTSVSMWLPGLAVAVTFLTRICFVVTPPPLPGTLEVIRRIMGEKVAGPLVVVVGTLVPAAPPEDEDCGPMMRIL